VDQIIIFAAKFLFLLIPLAWVAIWLRIDKKQKREMLIATALALVFAVILDKIAGSLFYDTRPFVSQSITPLITHSADNGFPSEHTLFSLVIAGVLWFYNKRIGTAALIVVAIVGCARVAAKVHSPADIIGGVILGLAAVYAAVLIVRKLIASKKATKFIS
jgi:undecaprenyl-diphosphatase